jgi:hypothetical protein
MYRPYFLQGSQGDAPFGSSPMARLADNPISILPDLHQLYSLCHRGLRGAIAFINYQSAIDVSDAVMGDTSAQSSAATVWASLWASQSATRGSHLHPIPVVATLPVALPPAVTLNTRRRRPLPLLKATVLQTLNTRKLLASCSSTLLLGPLNSPS